MLILKLRLPIREKLRNEILLQQHLMVVTKKILTNPLIFK